MTFAEFCGDLRVTESEAHELVDFLAAFRMRKTLAIKNQIKPDQTTDEIIEDWKNS
jgi:hypothetical protein